MKAESVAQSFDSYRRTVIPAGAPQIQIDECERAFYAGTYFILMNLLTHIGDDSTSEEEGIQQLEALKAECEAFAIGERPLPTPGTEQHYTTPDAAEFKPLLQDLGRLIGGMLPTGWGFTLLMFTFGAGGSLFYISNAQREDVLNTMREFLQRETH